MKRLNCIVVFDKEKEHILFCRRTKDPYKDLYNFVGGKVETGEDSPKRHIVSFLRRQASAAAIFISAVSWI